MAQLPQLSETIRDIRRQWRTRSTDDLDWRKNAQYQEGFIAAISELALPTSRTNQACNLVYDAASALLRYCRDEDAIVDKLEKGLFSLDLGNSTEFRSAVSAARDFADALGHPESRSRFRTVLEKISEDYFVGIRVSAEASLRVDSPSHPSNNLPRFSATLRDVRCPSAHYIPVARFRLDLDRRKLLMAIALESSDDDIDAMVQAVEHARRFMQVGVAILMKDPVDSVEDSPGDADEWVFDNASLVWASEFSTDSLPEERSLWLSAIRTTGTLLSLTNIERQALQPKPAGMAFHSWQSMTKGFPTPQTGKLVEVYFGTNREPATTGSDVEFGIHRSDSVSYGKCEVIVPRSHRFGSVGSGWFRRLIAGDDRLTLHCTSLLTQPQALKEVQCRLAHLKPDDPAPLVYIHGFNVTFEEAAIRTAQLQVDLKTPIAAFFSWPSRGQLTGYAADCAAIEASEAQLTQFLTSFATVSGDRKLNVIAHSMGNRGLLRALHRAIAGIEADAALRLNQVFLAAPDVDVGVFLDLAKIYPTLSIRTTLYVCGRDKAVELSKWLYDYPRAGFCPPVTICPGIDTVEATDLDLTLLGHSYYAEAEPLLYDMYLMLRNDSPPDRRPRLTCTDLPEGSRFWRIAR